VPGPSIRQVTGFDTPWEPPWAGTETEQLFGALDRLRTTFRWKCDGLDAASLRHRLGVSALSLGGLLKHLALVEVLYAGPQLNGEPLAEPWAGEWDAQDWDWPFTSADHDPPEKLYADYDAAVARCRSALTETVSRVGLDAPSALRDAAGKHASVRRLVCDLIEEYGRHTGHADLLREAVDGLVGEDPPPGWSASHIDR
jgi:Protein of unknown function (DUF664)